MQIKPILIAVEGIDGAGKSTQIPRIADWFRAHGMTVSISCEPTRAHYGLQIRTATERLAPDVERRLFVEDRKEHLRDVIEPALARGEIAITDRYFYSSIAYQGTRADAFDHEPTQAELELLQDEIHDEHKAFAREADILILIRLDVDIALDRMKAGRESLDPFENRLNLTRVAQAFERVARKHPCVITADAANPPDAVTAEIIRQLEICPLFQ